MEGRSADDIDEIRQRHAFHRLIGILLIVSGVGLFAYGWWLSETRKEILFGAVPIVAGVWRYWIHRKVR